MNRRKKNNKKRRLERETQRLSGRLPVDDYFSKGPLEVYRSGKLVVMQNNATPAQQSQILSNAKAANKELRKDMEAKIKGLQAEISKYDPLELMHYAGYKALGLLMHGKTESEMTVSEGKVLPNIEYLQYLIARTPAVKDAGRPSDQELENIWARLTDINETTLSYLMTRPTKKSPPSETDGLVQMIDQMRLNVRVMRFPNFQEDYWRESLSPYNNLLIQAYGIDAEGMIEGLSEISEFQKRGVIAKHKSSMEAVDRLRKRAKELGLDENDPENYKKQLEVIDELKQLNEDVSKKFSAAWTVDLFEITNVSSLPKNVLKLLSVKPGENPLSKLTGDNHEDLSPLSTDVEHYKPFLEVDGKFYTFYHAGFEDRIAEIIQNDLNKRFTKQRSSIEKVRSEYIEGEAIRLLTGILKPNYQALNLYYPNPDDNGNPTELDGLLEADDLLVLVEVKSGGISAGAARGAPGSIVDDLKDLIFEGQRQSERAERYIRSAGKVDFYDQTGKKVLHSVEVNKFRKVIRVVVTRESLGWIGARLARLAVLDPTLNETMPWHISIDDLRAVAELFDGKSVEFSHYLQVRLEAAENKALSQSDEIDHVALYNAMNYYHNNIDSSASIMLFNAYSLPIDRYFMDKMSGDKPDRPEQKLPKEMRSLVNALESTELSHRFEVGAILLGGDSSQRKSITKHLQRVLNQPGAKGSRILRIGSPDMKVGISIGHVPAAIMKSEYHRLAGYMRNIGLNRWLSVNIDVADGLLVTDIDEIKIEDYTEEQIAEAQALIEKSLNEKISGMKIARNQMCPCGSNLRFKNCHGKKHA